jgi:hypothetical protein
MKSSIPADSIPAGHAGIDARLKLGPRIHRTAYVVPSAIVIGDVTLMEESSVGMARFCAAISIESPLARAPTSRTMPSSTSTRLTRRGSVSLSPSATAPSSTHALSTTRCSSGWAQLFWMDLRSALAPSSAPMPWSLSEQRSRPVPWCSVPLPK